MRVVQYFEEPAVFPCSADVDFHWYVLNHHGLWSHKPGQTAAVNWDNAGAPINNVRACNMGNYRFRSYMATNYLTTIQ